MKNLLKSLLVLFAGAALFAGCKQAKEAADPSGLPATTVSVTPEAIAPTAEPSAAFEVEVKADGTWVVVNSLDWVSVDPKVGEGNATVTVTVADNKDAEGNILAPRSGVITFLGSETASATLTINQEGNNDLLIKTIPYSIDFTAGYDDWTIDDGVLPDGMTYVWSLSSSYGMKASAYVNSTNNPTDAYLISPVFNLTSENVAILSFSHARKYGDLSQLSVVAKKADDADWTVLTVENWPDGSSWDFVDSGEIDLSAFCGSKMQIAFHYTSSADGAATWEINSFNFTNDASPKFTVSPETIDLKAVETSASVKVAGNVDWTVTCPDGVTASPASGKGGATVTVTVPANTDLDNTKSYEVKFATTADVETKEYTVTINQEKAEPAAAATLAELSALATSDGASFNAVIKDVVVTYVYGSAAFLEDTTAGIEVYCSGHGLTAGNVLNGTVSGTIKLYQGFAEITTINTGDLTITNTEDIPCTVVTADELVANTSKYINKRIKLEDVVVTTAVAGKANGAVKQGNTEVTVRGGDSSVNLAVDAEGDLTCYPQLYSSALQVYVYDNAWFEQEIVTPDAKIYINEVSTGDKKLELYNASDAEVALKGYTLKQRNDSTKAYNEWNFASLTEAVTIPANGFVVVNCKQDAETTGPTFGLSGTKGFQLQLTYGEDVIDSVDNLTNITTIADGQSYGRESDGAEKWVVFGTPSLGETNANGKLVPDATTCAQIDSLILAGKTSIIVDFADYVEVTLVNGKNVFAQDATGGLLFYGTGFESWAYCGFRFKGYFVINAKAYNGVPEITGVTSGLDTMEKNYNPGWPCTNISVADLLANYDRYVNCKVKIDGVSVTDGWQATAGDRDGTISDGTNELAVRSQVSTDSLLVKTGCEGNIVAWPSYYKTTKQLGFWPNPDASKTYFTVTKEPVDPDEPEVTVYKSCAEVNAAILAGETSLKCNFETAVAITMMGTDGKSIYLMDTDNGGGMLIYNTEIFSAAKTAGVDCNWGVKGEFELTAKLYNGLPEITAATLDTSNFSQIYKYPCKDITIADLLASYDKYYNCKVKIDGVSVTDGWQGTTDRDGKISDGTNELAVRVQDKYDSLLVKTGCEGNIVAWPSIYNTKQLGFWPNPDVTKTNFTVTKEPTTEPEVPVYKSCAEVNAAILAGETSLKCNFETPVAVTLMGSDSRSIYLMDQDNGGGILLYNQTLYSTAKAAGVDGNWGVYGEFELTAELYNGTLPEVTAATIGAGNLKVLYKYPCKNLTIAELAADFNKYVNCKIMIADVDVTDGWSASDRNGEIAQGEDKIPVYVKNTGITVVIPTGSKGAFVGYPSYSRDTKQMTFWEDSKFSATSMPGIITVKDAVSIAAGDSLALGATANSGATLTYSSDNEAVATVSAEGLVKAIAAGTANITVTAPAKDPYTEATATVAVTVVEGGEPGSILAYTLAVTKNTSNTAYASMYDVTVDGVAWKLPGNQGLDGDKIKIGGKLSAATDRYMYSEGSISGDLCKIILTHGTKDSAITVNSVTITVYSTADDAANATNAVDTVSAEYVDNGTMTFTRTDGKSWKDSYFRINYNLSSSAASSNKGIIFLKGEFYK